MKNPKKSTPVRVNLSLTSQVKDRIEHLVANSECDTMTEVVRRSLALYDLVLDMQKTNGCDLYVKYPDGNMEKIIIL